MVIATHLLGVLQHSLGQDQYGRRQPCSVRNHFVASPGTADHHACTELVSLGLMERRPPSALTGGGDLFMVTPAGASVCRDQSPPAPKLTRSQRRYLAWLTADSGEPFGDWLRRHTTTGGPRVTPY